MARSPDIKIVLDDWITNTRIYECVANCEYRYEDSFNCRVKEVSLNEDGKCENFKYISTRNM